MKKLYNIKDECNRLNCDETIVEDAILSELVEEYDPDTDFIFNYIDDDNIEVEIISDDSSEDF